MKRKLSAVIISFVLLVTASVFSADKASAGTWYDWGWWNSSTGSVHFVIDDQCPSIPYGNPGKATCRVVHIDEHVWATGQVVYDALVFRLPEWAWPEWIYHGVYGSQPWEVGFDIWVPYRNGGWNPVEQIQWNPVDYNNCSGNVCGVGAGGVDWRRTDLSHYAAGNTLHNRLYGRTANSLLITDTRGTVHYASVLV